MDENGILIETLVEYIQILLDDFTNDEYAFDNYVYPDGAITDETIWDYTTDKWILEQLLELVHNRVGYYKYADDAIYDFGKIMENCYYATIKDDGFSSVYKAAMNRMYNFTDELWDYCLGM